MFSYSWQAKRIGMYPEITTQNVAFINFGKNITRHGDVKYVANEKPQFFQQNLHWIKITRVSALIPNGDPRF